MQKFESYLQKVQLMQKVLIYFIPIIVIGGLLFMYIIPTQEEELEMLDSESSKLHSNIKRKSSKSIKSKITKSNKNLLSLKEKVDESRDSLNFLYSKLTNMEVLEFDETQWTITLDDILKKSLDLNIKIQHIKNNDSDKKEQNNQIVPKKYVEVIGSGNYSNVLKYLNFIENREFLVDMKNIKMIKKDNGKDIDFHFNFTIYGVNI